MPACLEHGRSYESTGICGFCGFPLCSSSDHAYSKPGKDETVRACSICKSLHSHVERSQKQLDQTIILLFGTVGFLVFLLAFGSFVPPLFVLVLSLATLILAAFFFYSLIRWYKEKQLDPKTISREFTAFLDPFSPLELQEYHLIRLNSIPTDEKGEGPIDNSETGFHRASISSLLPTESSWKAIWSPMEKTMKEKIEKLGKAPLDAQLVAHLDLIENFTEKDPSVILDMSKELDPSQVDPTIGERLVSYLYSIGEWRIAWLWEQQGIQDRLSRCAFVETAIRESRLADTEYRDVITTLSSAPEEFKHVISHLAASDDPRILIAAVNLYAEMDVQAPNLVMPAFQTLLANRDFDSTRAILSVGLDPTLKEALIPQLLASDEPHIVIAAVILSAEMGVQAPNLVMPAVRTLLGNRDLDSIRAILHLDLNSELKETIILEFLDERWASEISSESLAPILAHSPSERVLDRFEQLVSQWQDSAFLESALLEFTGQNLPEHARKIASRLTIARASHFLETGSIPQVAEGTQQLIDEYAERTALKTIDALYQAQSLEKRGETQSALSCYENILSFGTLSPDQVHPKILSLESLEADLSTLEKVLARTASGIPLGPEKLATLTGLDSDACRTYLLAYQSRWEPLGSYLEYEDVFFKPTVDVGLVSAQAEAISPAARSITITCASCGTEITKNAQCPVCDFQNASCEICRSPVNYGQEVALCPFCETSFHAPHLREWLRVKGACPICKNALKEKYYIQLETITAELPQTPIVAASHPKQAFIHDITAQIASAEQSPDPAGAILLCGRILEGIIQELYEMREGPREKRKGTLHSMTKTLVKKGVIPPHIHVWAGTVRLHRNRIAHEFSKPSQADSQLIVGSIRAILDWFVEESAKGVS